MHTITIDLEKKEVILDDMNAQEIQEILNLLSNLKEVKLSVRSKKKEPYITIECSGTQYSKNRDLENRIQI